MKQARTALLLTAALLFSGLAAAQQTVDQTVLTSVKSALSTSATSLIGPKAMGWLGAFMTLQFVLTNFSLLKSGGDISEVMAKFVGAMLSGGLCILAMTYGPSFIDAVGTGFLSSALSSIPTAGDIITGIVLPAS